VIGRARREHLGDHLLVAIHALHLVERTLVVRQAQPLHAVDDGLHRLRRRTRDVGVLDAQDEGAAMAAGIGPGKQRRAGAADVQETGGTGGEAGADRHGISSSGKGVNSTPRRRCGLTGPGLCG
jgi:hypothetical protein